MLVEAPPSVGFPFLPSFIRVIREIRGSPFLPSFIRGPALSSVETSSDPFYNAIISSVCRYDFVTIRGVLHMGGGVR